jgi:hypothetical protein
MYGKECCPMSSFRPEWAARPDFHPEFGYLCHSPRRRRRLRLVLAAAVAALGVGATMALAGAHRGDAEGDGLAPTVQADMRLDSATPSTPAGGAAASVAPTQSTCKSAATADPAASFLSVTCRSSKLHARHGARAAYRVAIVVPVRSDVPPASTEDASKPVAPTANGPSGVAAGAQEPAAAMSPAPTVHATPRPRKPKVAPDVAMARELSRQDAMVNAYAYDPSYERLRSDSPQRGFGGLFGGRW